MTLWILSSVFLNINPVTVKDFSAQKLILKYLCGIHINLDCLVCIVGVMTKANIAQKSFSFEICSRILSTADQ